MSGMKPFNWQQVERIFLASRPETCPYLPGQREQKLVTLIQPGDIKGFAHLSEQGFRRSHDAAYQPACPTCQACQSLRVRAKDFKPNKTQRRLKNRYQNLNLSAEDLSLSAENQTLDGEHWPLFHAYVKGRHGQGSMADMGRQDFAAMVRDSPIQTKLLSWRDGQDGPLVAACLTDILPDGLSAVYSYFSLAPTMPSLGTYVILALLDLACRADLDFVHLGFWVAGSKTMDYKARFGPAEVYAKGRWQALPKSDAKP